MENHQELTVELQNVGPGEYGDPMISSPALRYVGPGKSEIINPAGPIQIFRLVAEEAGTAAIVIQRSSPIPGQSVPFELTVTVN